MSAGGGERSVESSWSRIEAWLRTHAAETFATLNLPADPVAIAAAEQAIGVPFPDDLVASLRVHDGTDSAGYGRFQLPHGFGLLSVTGIQQHWRMLGDILSRFDDEMVGYWWHPEWVPFADHIAGAALVVDQRPGGGQGTVGEFVNEGGAELGRWPSFAALLADAADLLEGRRTDNRAVPRVVSGRLVWGWTEELPPRPRSPLAIADAAGPEDVRAQTISARPFNPEEWILDLGRCCVTFARDLSESELISRFGGEPDRGVDLTAEQVVAREASWRTGYRPMLLAGRTNGWAFGVEQRHEYGIDIQTLRRVSAGTRAVSVACNGNITQFCCAEDGVVLVHFHNRWQGRLDGADPERFRPLLEQANLLPFDPERYVEDEALGALALALRLGPGEFDPAVLAGPMLAAAVLPLLTEPLDEPRRLPVQADPELVAAIEYATEEQLRPAVIALARRRVTDLGLDDHPEIDAALVAAVGGATGPVDDDSPLGRTLRTLRAEAHAAAAAFLDHADRSARNLITEQERAAWQRRGRLAGDVAEIVARPAMVAAYSLVGSPATFAERADFLADLAGVAVPADAVARLERAERDRPASYGSVRLWHRQSRRRQGPPPAVALPAASRGATGLTMGTSEGIGGTLPHLSIDSSGSVPNDLGDG